MRFLTQLASRAFINHEVRISPTDAPDVAAGNRIAFMEGMRGGFVVDLRSSIGSGSVGKEGGRIGLSTALRTFPRLLGCDLIHTRAVMIAPSGNGQNLVCL
jgi:hypothetical protein